MDMASASPSLQILDLARLTGLSSIMEKRPDPTPIVEALQRLVMVVASGANQNLAVLHLEGYAKELSLTGAEYAPDLIRT